ncbi:3',5'-cyclic-nucleotide phosphodiesterase [Marasmius tenuissimus]|nr:3',5'-cyclic-nucleotide phosphodiesterase [Marasmius tenuissimus]
MPSHNSADFTKRRRSADLGGLHLATAGSGYGQGWLGHSCKLETQFAELLSDMFQETRNAVNEHDTEFAPTDLPLETRARLIQSLDSWNFEPHKLPDEEVLACTMILFEALFRIEGLQSLVRVELDQIYPLIHHLRRIYRWENPYHNFEHALDVLQASYTFLRLAGMVPSVTILLDSEEAKWSTSHPFDSGPLMTTLRPQDLFVIYIAAIGHDVAHPGFTNVFMKNAQAPLSVVFDNKSPLEQMHISLLLRVMRHHGLGPLLDDPTDQSGQHVRKLLSETVLATDMSVHAKFMDNFRSLLSGNSAVDLCRRQVLTCQAIIKCADISNPYRPYHVAKHWAAALMGEWSSQAMLEKCMHLPTTVQASDDPLMEAKGQLFFINTFAKPLLELVTEAVPELQQLLQQCKSNLGVWESRRTELESREHSTNNGNDTSRSTTSPAFRDDYSTAFPLTLPPSHPYRNLLHVDSRVSLDQLTNGQSETSAGETNCSSDYGEEQLYSGTPPLSSAATAVSDTFTGSTFNWVTGANGGKGDRPKLPTPPPSSSESDSAPCSPVTDGSSEYGSCMDSPHPTSSARSGNRSRTSSSRSSYVTGISTHPANRSILNGTHNSYHHPKTGHRSHDSTCSTNTSSAVYAAHAAIRAAADSAGAGLRKKRSMANRNSWGPSILAPREDADSPRKSGLFAMSKPLTLPFSLSPPPMSSPPILGNGNDSSIVVAPDTTAVALLVSHPPPVARPGVQ